MSAVTDDLNTFIVDCGSTWFKFGNAGDEVPRGYFPSVIGSPINKIISNDADESIATDANKTNEDVRDNKSDGIKKYNNSGLSITSMNMNNNYFENYHYFKPWDYSRVKARMPLENQSVISNDAMQSDRTQSGHVRDSLSPEFSKDVFRQLIHRALTVTNYNQSEYDLRDSSLLMVDPDINSIENANQTLEVIFEDLGLGSAYLSKKAVLSLFSIGKTSGVPIQIGSTGTTITPVIDGYALHRNAAWTPFGGDTMDDYLSKSIIKKIELSAEETADSVNCLKYDSFESVEYWRYRCNMYSLKEALLRVTPADPRGPKKISSSISSKATYYELPDGTIVDAHDPPCVSVPELFFSPEIIKDLEIEINDDLNMVSSLPDTVRQVILASDTDSRKALINSISLHGGIAKIPGFQERFARSMFNDTILSRITKPRIHASTPLQDKSFSAYLGASILGCLSSFKQMWISRVEYEEYGSSVLAMRCL